MKPALCLVLFTALVGCDAPTAPPTMPVDVDPRQAARDTSLFRNLSFEEVDAAGAAIGWTCQCGDAISPPKDAPCTTTTRAPSHGQRALVLPAGCAASQVTTAFDGSRDLRFDYVSRGAVVYPGYGSAFALAQAGVVDTAFVDGLEDAADAWRPVQSVGALSTAQATRLALMLRNNTQTDVEIDDVVAVQDAPNPLPRAGVLLRGDHYETLSYRAGDGPSSFYVSLPIDHASQVPLHVELEVTPASVVERIEYVSEDEGNWGAIVHLVPSAIADEVVVAWKGVVLDRDLSDAERPAVYAAKGDPARWLPASAIADAAYPPILANARAIAPAPGGALAALQATIDFTSAYVTNAGELMALDATSVWNTRDASCTGFTNLASATGRALGVPTRHVTNILVGQSQNLHSVNEFYLGPALGWRRVEPQGTSAVIPEDYGLIMRLVLPEDEVADALPTSAWVLGGAPLREFTAPVEGGDRLSPGFTSTHFADCDVCQNRADPQATLRAPAGDVKRTFERARVAWERDRDAYLAGGLSPERMAMRRGFLAARSLADVDRLLDLLP